MEPEALHRHRRRLGAARHGCGRLGQQRRRQHAGAVGDPYSPHYRDLFPLWAGGDYFPLAFSDAAVAAAARDIYDLTPALDSPKAAP
ncbi:MAG: penicillin acylase family protein [Caulobacteraceae bacterium]